LPGEQEYLFVPYSAFEVVDVNLQGNKPGKKAGTLKNPFVITVEATDDNADEPEDLPLAPWY